MQWRRHEEGPASTARLVSGAAACVLGTQEGHAARAAAGLQLYSLVCRGGLRNLLFLFPAHASQFLASFFLKQSPITCCVFQKSASEISCGTRTPASVGLTGRLHGNLWFDEPRWVSLSCDRAVTFFLLKRMGKGGGPGPGKQPFWSARVSYCFVTNYHQLIIFQF